MTQQPTIFDYPQPAAPSQTKDTKPAVWETMSRYRTRFGNGAYKLTYQKLASF